MTRSARSPLRRPAMVGSSLVLALAVSSPGALAQGASVVVEPAGPLPGGQNTLVVSGQGFATGGNGIYVVFGPVTPAPGYYMDPSLYGSFKWVTPGGAETPATAPLAPDGSFSTTLEVTSLMTTSAGQIDCAATPCAVITFAAHGSPDRSQDTCTAVSFTSDGTGSPSPDASTMVEAQASGAPVGSRDPSASLVPTADDPCALIGAAAP